MASRPFQNLEKLCREGVTMFENSDLKDFWNSHEYYTENYVEEPLTDEIIAFYENKLGFKLHKSYIQLMKIQNGGAPKKRILV